MPDRRSAAKGGNQQQDTGRRPGPFFTRRNDDNTTPMILGSVATVSRNRRAAPRRNRRNSPACCRVPNGRRAPPGTGLVNAVSGRSAARLGWLMWPTRASQAPVRVRAGNRSGQRRAIRQMGCECRFRALPRQGLEGLADVCGC